jgi:hypothetical protein
MPFFIPSPFLQEREIGKPVCIIYISARYGNACIPCAGGLKSIIFSIICVISVENMNNYAGSVIPAKAGIHGIFKSFKTWIPVFTGMTAVGMQF